jgi:hypothetical protein
LPIGKDGPPSSIHQRSLTLIFNSASEAAEAAHLGNAIGISARSPALPSNNARRRGAISGD